MKSDGVLGASFRDPSGFVFQRNGVILRQVNERYAADYQALHTSGLFEKLVSKKLLVAHEEIDVEPEVAEGHFRTLRPERIPFVSYPYEWCFSQLKDAALATLRIQRIALGCGMSLKDASAYNLLFRGSQPVFIDTLSFEQYREGSPWVAYRQFCEHFLAPLSLMSRIDPRLQQLLRVHIDGIPLDLASSLLGRTWFDLGLSTHIKMHARFQHRHRAAGDVAVRSAAVGLSKDKLQNLLRDLQHTVEKLVWKPEGTEWAEYYSGDSYEEASLGHKKDTVASFLRELQPEVVWDLGANTGVYTRIASGLGAFVISYDFDPACVERSYLEQKRSGEERILPLLLDLLNPSPALGFSHRERESWVDRAPADTLLALALIHHLAITGNVPLSRIATLFASLATSLVIEWVPKEDPKVRTLLATREDVFDGYTHSGFEAAFASQWRTERRVDVEGSDRSIYLMRRR